MQYLPRLSVIILIILMASIVNINSVHAHLIGMNVITKKVGDYEVRFQTLPLYPTPGQPVTLGFSVLDQQGYNIWNMEAIVKVQQDGEIIFTSPKTKYEISDFYLEYTFPDNGNYQIVLEGIIPEQPEALTADFGIIIGQETNFAAPNMMMIAGGIAGAGAIAGALYFKRRGKAAKI
jgi:hypothetical protein